MDSKLFAKYVTPYVLDSRLLIQMHEDNRQRYELLSKSYESMHETFEHWKHRALPNNKLKFMGEPMRRR